jgi:hypothetical protein
MSKDNNNEKRIIPYHYWLTRASYNKILSQMYRHSPKKNTAHPMNFTPYFTWVYGVKQRERLLKQKAICDQRLRVHTHKDLVQMTT